MGKLLKLVLFAGGVWLALHLSGRDTLIEKNIAATLAPGNEVAMYSLTTCPYCKEKRQWLTRAGIPFREYFIDTDQPRRAELDELLAKHRVPGGGIGTPIVYINGDLLVNNPDRAEIRRRLKFKS